MRSIGSALPLPWCDHSPSMRALNGASVPASTPGPERLINSLSASSEASSSEVSHRPGSSNFSPSPAS
ncbi:hypothetical protein RLIN73S_06028 [Rhodanobacter lindaniclasticus]